jgi:thioesterase domain-containing protein
MKTDYLENYLHEHIPLSAAMKVSVCSITSDSVALSAPLSPNINHKNTVFGGSASALGILAAWSILHVRLVQTGLRCEVVIQSNQIDYERPIRGDFIATSSLSAPATWPLFTRMLIRKKKARIEVQSLLTCEETRVGTLRGRFVAFLQDAL